MKRNFMIIASVAFAVGSLTAMAATTASHAQMNTGDVEVITNGPQPGPGDGRVGRTATENVRDSQRYEAMVHANAGFRAARERKECGPISDARMHADCLASFGE
jgi:hypothetical protein